MPPLRVVTWNVFHGRDFPPDPALRTWRSKLLRVTELGATHAQVNADLSRPFAETLAACEWDVALLQECPPHWAASLAARCQAETHRVLTARNSLPNLRRFAARLNPDLIGSNGGGSNLILVRDGAGAIVERRQLVLAPGPRPERRALGFVRLASGLCIANLHASSGSENRTRAEAELRLAAERCTAWAGAPLVLGGDLNVRPRDSPVFEQLAADFGLGPPTAPDSLDHLLAAGLRVVAAPAACPPEAREVHRPDGLRLRLSDHAPVAGTFDSPAQAG